MANEPSIELRAAAEGMRMVGDFGEKRVAWPNRLRSWKRQPFDSPAVGLVETWGYHSRVYNADFKPPPQGAHFDSGW